MESKITAPATVSTNRTLLVLIAAVVFLKAILLWAVMPLAARYGLAPGTVATAHDLYINIAQSLVDGHGYRVTPETAQTMMRGPGYVLMLAAIQSVFGDGIVPAQAANLLFGAGTVWIVFVLTRQLTGSDTSASLAALVTAFHPAMLVMETRVNVESFFILLLSLFVLLLFRAFESGTPRRFFMAGLMLGVVTLTRSSPIVIIPLIFLFLLVRDGRNAESIKRVTVNTMALGIGAVVLLLPWTIRNYELSGKPTFSENLLGIVAFQGQYVTRTMDTGEGYQVRIQRARDRQTEYAKAAGADFRRFDGDTFWDVFPSIEDELLYNEAILDEVVRLYRNDPWLFVRHCVVNSLRFWFQGATPKITSLGVIVTLPLLIVALVGAYIAIRRGIMIGPLFLVIVTVYAVHLPLISHARYSTPLVPLLAVLIGIAASCTAFGGARADPPGIAARTSD